MWGFSRYIYTVLYQLNEDSNGHLNSSLVYNLDIIKIIIPKVWMALSNLQNAFVNITQIKYIEVMELLPIFIDQKTEAQRVRWLV